VNAESIDPESLAPAVPTPGGPLEDHHYQEMERAAERARPVRRAARVAAFNGWTTAIFAVLSIPFAFSGLVALLIAVGLSVVAFMEFRGRRGLLKFDPKAATQLGWNQTGFMVLIVAYCGWMLLGGAPDISERPEVSQLLGAEGRALYKTIVIAVYGTVIALTVVFQGGNAIYYFTRRKHVEAYLQQTPQWVQDFRRSNRI
jgi:hypothetical protein